MCLLIALFCQSLVVYDRLLLGKHTIDQVLVGTLLGVWLALLCHFCLRDRLYDNITTITGRLGPLSTQIAKKYTLNAFAITSCFYLV